MNQAITDLLAGQMDIVFDSPAPLAHLLLDGKIKALVGFGPQRMAMLPDVPIMGLQCGPLDPAGAQEGRQHHAFGRSHQRLQAVPLEGSVPAVEHAEPGDREEGQGEIRLAVERQGAGLKQHLRPHPEERPKGASRRMATSTEFAATLRDACFARSSG